MNTSASSSLPLARLTAQQPLSLIPPSFGKVERTGDPCAAASPVTSW